MQVASTSGENGRASVLPREVEYLADRIGPSELNVLISGEPGVGKHRIANRIFERSARRTEPLIRIRCADVLPGLLGNNLDEPSLRLNRMLNRIGSSDREPFRATLLLEGIHGLEPASQAVLFQLAEEKEGRRSAGEKPHVDFRLMATTTVDLRDLADQGRFRQDLLYRLKVGHLHIPPLRQRPRELAGLLAGLLQKYARHFSGSPRPELKPAHWQMLRSYSWPGNDEEFEDFVKSLVALRNVETAFEVLQQKIRLERKVSHPLGSLHALSRLARDRAERRLIEGVLRQTRGDSHRAAQILGISRNLLEEKMKELKLPVPEESVENIGFSGPFRQLHF